MAVPDYQSFMLPLLYLADDGEMHSLSEAIEVLAEHFQLTDDDRKAMLPSGRQTLLYNRVGWARTYLTKAGLLSSGGRGKFQLTQLGKDVLTSNPAYVNADYLNQFAAFREFKSLSRRVDSQPIADEVTQERFQTPDDLLESSYQTLRNALAQELLERVKQVTPSFFEYLVVDLVVAMGYGGSRKDAGEAVIGRSGDEGIDGVIKEDRLGLDAIYIQAKRWENSVGRPVLQAFVGSLEGQGATKGIFITTSFFTQEAKDYVRRLQQKKVVLIDGETLTQLMIDYNIGVAERATYTIKKVDEDYFIGE